MRARPDREDNHGTGRPHLLDKTNALVARGLQGSAADQHILTTTFRDVTIGSWTMPRKSIGETAMTDAERQARCRAARKADTPVTRRPRPMDHRSRAKRWHDAVAELVEVQRQYTAWLEALPTNLQDSTTAEALQAICDFDLAELQSIEPPRGFGRD
jgi:hypothetical protein